MVAQSFFRTRHANREEYLPDNSKKFGPEAELNFVRTGYAFFDGALLQALDLPVWMDLSQHQPGRLGDSHSPRPRSPEHLWSVLRHLSAFADRCPSSVRMGREVRSLGIGHANVGLRMRVRRR